jgi:hypothetical protein
MLEKIAMGIKNNIISGGLFMKLNCASVEGVRVVCGIGL